MLTFKTVMIVAYVAHKAWWSYVNKEVTVDWATFWSDSL
jgi:hypothetical protein